MSTPNSLTDLLKNLSPILDTNFYAYISVQNIESIQIEDIHCLYRESEGITLVLYQEIAEKYKLDYNELYAKITLQVNSSLNDVGLTAAVATQLGKSNIPCNVIAAFHHDHIFVPASMAELAMKALLALI